MPLPRPSSLEPVRLVGVLAFTQIVGWGTTFDLPGVLGRVMARDLGLANEWVFGCLTLMMLTGAATAPAIGTLLDRIGAARVLTAGSLLIAAGLATLAVANGIVLLYLAWLLVGVGGSAGLSLAAYAAIVERRGAGSKRTIGTLLLFTGLSSAICWPILSALEASLGWRGACLCGAAVHLLVCAPLHFLVLPPARNRTGPTIGTGAAGPPALTTRERRAAFALIAVATTLTTFVGFGIAPVMIELLERSGTAATMALWFASLRNVCGTAARLADTALGGRSSAVTTGIASCAMVLTGVAALALGGSPVLVVAFVVLYGFGAGVATLARALLPLGFFAAADYARLSSRLALPQNLANAAAPLVFTALLDRIGPGAVLALVALATVVALACLVGLRHLERPRAPAVA
ncbi:MFS transporter [Prosthecomicrobium sp. N25]|uniref:MFS transporter n=1 Tax=Prosthecomicrobium sp. N25 TaxID=3129254 RepID=UPI003076B5EA